MITIGHGTALLALKLFAVGEAVYASSASPAGPAKVKNVQSAGSADTPVIDLTKNGGTLQIDVWFTATVNLYRRDPSDPNHWTKLDLSTLTELERPSLMTLTMETGQNDTKATLHSKTPTILSFRYVVVPGDLSSHLDYVSSQALTRAPNIRLVESEASDLYAVDPEEADLTLDAPGTGTSLSGTAPLLDKTNDGAILPNPRQTYIVDAVPPTGSITINGGAAETNSTSVELRVTFADVGTGVEKIVLSSFPTMANPTIVVPESSPFTLPWTLLAGEGEKTVYFEVWDKSANRTYPALSDTILLDTVPPKVGSVTSPMPNGAYKAGTTFEIFVNFTEDVVATGTPVLRLETGEEETLAYHVGYKMKDGQEIRKSLRFEYVVETGQNTPNLDYLSTDALWGDIRDEANNFADLTLKPPGAILSLGYNASREIDTIPPSATSVDSFTDAGVYGKDSSIDVRVHFSENVWIVEAPSIRMETGEIDGTAIYHSGQGTAILTFRYSVKAGENSPDLDYASSDALSGTVRDAAGNEATPTLPAPGEESSLGWNEEIAVDTTPPTITVTTPAAVTSEWPILFTITISEPVSEPFLGEGLSIENGSLESIEQDGTVVRITVMPFDIPVTVTVSVFGDAVHDAAWNWNAESAPVSVVFGAAPSGPTAGTVYDGPTVGVDVDEQVSLSRIEANWADFADVTEYDWAIGTTPGGQEVLAFISAGAALSAARSGLSLQPDILYYVTVRGRNGAESATATSDGFRVPPPGLSVSSTLCGEFLPQPRTAPDVPVHSLTFKAGTADVAIQELILTPRSDFDVLPTLRLRLDANRDGVPDPTDPEIGFPLLVPANSERTILVTASWADAPLGGRYRIALQEDSDVVAMVDGTRTPVSGGFPLEGRRIIVAEFGSESILILESGSVVDGPVTQGDFVESARLVLLPSPVRNPTVTAVRVRYAPGLEPAQVEAVLLVLDQNDNGAFDAGEPVLASASPPSLDPAELAPGRTLAAAEKWLVVTKLSPAVPVETKIQATVRVADLVADSPVDGCDVVGPERGVALETLRLHLYALPLEPPDRPKPFAQNLVALRFEAKATGNGAVRLLEIRIRNTGRVPLRATLWRDGPVATAEGAEEMVFALEETVTAPVSFAVTYDLAGWESSDAKMQAFLDVPSGAKASVPVVGGLIAGPEIRVWALEGSTNTQREDNAAGKCLGSAASARPPGGRLPLVLLILYVLLRFRVRR